MAEDRWGSCCDELDFHLAATRPPPLASVQGGGPCRVLGDGRWPEPAGGRLDMRLPWVLRSSSWEPSVASECQFTTPSTATVTGRCTSVSGPGEDESPTTTR